MASRRDEVCDVHRVSLYAGMFRTEHSRPHRTLASSCCSWTRGVKIAGIGVLVAGLMIVASAIAVLVSPGDTSTKATTNASSAVGRMYVGSITNESFRVAWVSVLGTAGSAGYIRWGRSSETWDSFIGTDIRASGSIDYASPSAVHVAQTNLGSGAKMNASTTYWFKIIWDGIEYGDSAESDTSYGFADRVDFGCVESGRPWGITTAPNGTPTSEYSITGLVIGPPPLSMSPQSDARVMVRVNDGSGDSLAILDVTKYVNGSNGIFFIDISKSRRVSDGFPYAVPAGTAILLFLDKGDIGCPHDQEDYYPYFVYDGDQNATGSSPQSMHMHVMWYWSWFIPEMSGITLWATTAAIGTAVLVFRSVRTRR